MSKWRGHAIQFEENEWLYADSQPVRDNPNRPCGHCSLPNTPEGHDGCLGTLPGVMNACCGHGAGDEAYVQFECGKILRGQELFQMRVSLRSLLWNEQRQASKEQTMVDP